MTSFQDKTVLITGAGSGIGAATARRFAQGGARLVLGDRNGEPLSAVAGAIRGAGGAVATVVGDVTDAAHHEALVAEAMAAYGNLDVAVNNAGVGQDPFPLAEIDVETFSRVININLFGVFLGMKAQLRQMAAAQRGNIVNVASILGLVGRRNAGAYTAAKHAVVGLTKTAALDYAEANVRVNAVCPGYIETPLLAGRDTSLVAPLHALGRLGTADEVAALIAFLASDAASFATGGIHTCDGGFTAQ